MKLRKTIAVTFVTVVSLALSAAAAAHCDSLDGPANSSAVLAQEVTKAGRAYVEAYVDYIHFVESAHHLGQRGASHKHADTE